MQDKGFLGTLFDFSFSEFITTKVIKFILGLAMVVNAILTIVFIFGAFRAGWQGTPAREAQSSRRERASSCSRRSPPE